MNTTTALQPAGADALDRDSLVSATTDLDRAHARAAGRPSWDVRLGLGGILVAIVAAVTLAAAVPAVASPAQGAPAGAAIALVRGLQVFVGDPASAPLAAPGRGAPAVATCPGR